MPYETGPMNPPRAAWAEINLPALARNCRRVESIVRNGAHIMAVVKANAYGHGAVECSKTLLEAGASYLGVALLHEALQLRDAGIQAPVLVMTPPMPEEADAYIANDIDFTLCTLVAAERFSARAAALGKTAEAHVKIDTGMGRVGITPAETLEFVSRAASLPNIHIRGIATHYASSDEDIPYTSSQLRAFTDAIAALERSGFNIPLRHSANSGAILNLHESHLNCVRPGIVLYGYLPSQRMKPEWAFEPVLSLKAKIDFVKQVPRGTSISYGRKFFTDVATTIATVPIGYADGYSRRLSGAAWVLVRGKRMPVVGRICMDQIMLDVNGGHVRESDVVTLIGRDGANDISAWELANAIGTIPYEILTMISARVPRIFM